MWTDVVKKQKRKLSENGHISAYVCRPQGTNCYDLQERKQAADGQMTYDLIYGLSVNLARHFARL